MYACLHTQLALFLFTRPLRVYNGCCCFSGSSCCSSSQRSTPTPTTTTTPTHTHAHTPHGHTHVHPHRLHWMLLLLEAWLLLKPPAFKSCKPLQRDRSKSISRSVQAIVVFESGCTPWRQVDQNWCSASNVQNEVVWLKLFKYAAHDLVFL